MVAAVDKEQVKVKSAGAVAEVVLSKLVGTGPKEKATLEIFS